MPTILPTVFDIPIMRFLKWTTWAEESPLKNVVYVYLKLYCNRSELINSFKANTLYKIKSPEVLSESRLNFVYFRFLRLVFKPTLKTNSCHQKSFLHPLLFSQISSDIRLSDFYEFKTFSRIFNFTGSSTVCEVQKCLLNVNGASTPTTSESFIHPLIIPWRIFKWLYKCMTEQFSTIIK